jgi:hypothetical protein
VQGPFFVALHYHPCYRGSYPEIVGVFVTHESGCALSVAKIESDHPVQWAELETGKNAVSGQSHLVFEQHRPVSVTSHCSSLQMHQTLVTP